MLISAQVDHSKAVLGIPRCHHVLCVPQRHLGARQEFLPGNWSAGSHSEATWETSSQMGGLVLQRRKQEATQVVRRFLLSTREESNCGPQSFPSFFPNSSPRAPWWPSNRLPELCWHSSLDEASLPPPLSHRAQGTRDGTSSQPRGRGRCCGWQGRACTPTAYQQGFN